jgi:chromosome segregation ATPase
MYIVNAITFCCTTVCHVHVCRNEHCAQLMAENDTLKQQQVNMALDGAFSSSPDTSDSEETAIATTKQTETSEKKGERDSESKQHQAQLDYLCDQLHAKQAEVDTLTQTLLEVQKNPSDGDVINTFYQDQIKALNAAAAAQEAKHVFLLDKYTALLQGDADGVEVVAEPIITASLNPTPTLVEAAVIAAVAAAVVAAAAEPEEVKVVVQDQVQQTTCVQQADAWAQTQAEETETEAPEPEVVVVVDRQALDAAHAVIWKKNQQLSMLHEQLTQAEVRAMVAKVLSGALVSAQEQEAEAKDEAIHQLQRSARSAESVQQVIQEHDKLRDFYEVEHSTHNEQIAALDSQVRVLTLQNAQTKYEMETKAALVGKELSALQSEHMDVVMDKEETELKLKRSIMALKEAQHSREQSKEALGLEQRELEMSQQSFRSTLKQQQETQEGLAKRANHSEQQLRETRDQLEDAKIECVALEGKFGLQLKQQQKLATELEAVKEAMKSNTQGMQKMSKQMTHSDAEKAQLQQQVGQLREHNESLGGRMQEVSAALELKVSVLEAVSRERESLQDKVTVLSSQVAVLTQEQEELCDAHCTLQMRMEELTSASELRLDGLQHEATQAQEAYTQLEEKYLELLDDREGDEFAPSSSSAPISSPLNTSSSSELVQMESRITQLKNDKAELVRQVQLLLPLCDMSSLAQDTGTISAQTLSEGKSEDDRHAELRQMLQRGLEMEAKLTSAQKMLQMTKDYAVEYKHKGDQRLQVATKKAQHQQKLLTNQRQRLVMISLVLERNMATLRSHCPQVGDLLDVANHGQSAIHE